MWTVDLAAPTSCRLQRQAPEEGSLERTMKLPFQTPRSTGENQDSKLGMNKYCSRSYPWLEKWVQGSGFGSATLTGTNEFGPWEPIEVPLYGL